MNIIASDRAFRVTHQDGDRDFRESDVIPDAREAMSQDVRRAPTSMAFR